MNPPLQCRLESPAGASTQVGGGSWMIAGAPRFWYRDTHVDVDGSSLSRLLNEASEETVGLTQELRAADVLSAASFQTDTPRE